MTQMTEEQRKEFLAWMKKVDSCILNVAGVSHEDLPDFMYEYSFLDGATPEETAREAIEEAGGEELFEEEEDY